MSDKPRAVLFDLFGTLVPAFRRAEHEAAIARCAATLELPTDECHRLWVESFPRRIRGDFGSVAENFRWIAGVAGRRTSLGAAEEAEESYLEFTRSGLQPVSGALETLEWIRSLGIPLALVTNCAPDVPRAWKESVLAPYFSEAVFSCRVGAVKPEREIYMQALDSLKVVGSEALFVGDGSDSELSGATECGMRAVLVGTDLSNTYDVKRADLECWMGTRIETLGGLREIGQDW